MSIGWIIFWKSVVLAVFAALLERWTAFREKRAKQGLPLRYSRKKGRYVVFDWTAYAERFARALRTALYLMAGFWVAILASSYLWGGEQMTRQLIRALLGI